MFIVESSDLDPVEDIGLFSWSLFTVIHENVPNLKWEFVNGLCGSFNLSAFGWVFMESWFLVGCFGVERTNPLSDVYLGDGPCIKKHFANLIQLLETDKDPSFGQWFGSFYLESLKVSYIVTFGSV
jgi:hypothetical protein